MIGRQGFRSPLTRIVVAALAVSLLSLTSCTKPDPNAGTQTAANTSDPSDSGNPPEKQEPGDDNPNVADANPNGSDPTPTDGDPKVPVPTAGIDEPTDDPTTDEPGGLAAPEAPMDPEAPVIAFPYGSKFPAPPLEGGTAWMNTSGELTGKDLRGKFVFLDFWTYCCINCMHILPELKKLEHAYPNNVVVIGVHSAKFDTEKDTENIREAILRYDIEHPVVNDAEMLIWRNFQCRSWPSLRIIDPEGNVIAGHSGEIAFEDLERLVKVGLPYYRAKGTLDERPLQFNLEKYRRRKASPLYFPGKVLADEKSNRLFIADSNHDRIVISDLNGELLDVIGIGSKGLKDGGYDEAQFHDPQGMALREETLYVADNENHAIRKIDLKTKQVKTISGTGKQRRELWPGFDPEKTDAEGKFVVPERYVDKAAGMDLSSPWALWIHKEDLYIAMAGPHQIWKMTLDETEMGPYAGSGRED
ncbi:MAG: thioredoxin-like domain-containing protein, partial [Planctomycetales bacterium]